MTTSIIETAPIESTDIIPYNDTDDGKDHLTHIINPPANGHIYQPGMTAQDIVDTARITREFVIALCGHKFVPERDPQKYPACQTCFDIAGLIMSEDG